MPQVEVLSSFGLEHVGTIIDLEAKDAAAKVEAGLAKYVAQAEAEVPQPVQAEVKTDVETEVQKLEAELKEVEEKVESVEGK